MTITTLTGPLAVEIEAVMVEQGDYIYCRQLDDWVRVRAVRHYQSASLGWRVTLVIESSLPYDSLDLAEHAPVMVAY